MSNRRELAKVGDLIDSVLGKVARTGVAPVVRLRQQWEVIAGEWASKTRPVALNHGVLSLEVRSGLDASMLRYEIADLLRAVQEELAGEVAVTRIAVRVTSSGSGPK